MAKLQPKDDPTKVKRKPTKTPVKRALLVKEEPREEEKKPRLGPEARPHLKKKLKSKGCKPASKNRFQV
jgi:hypothetical protein